MRDEVRENKNITNTKTNGKREKNTHTKKFLLNTAQPLKYMHRRAHSSMAYEVHL